MNYTIRFWERKHELYCYCYDLGKGNMDYTIRFWKHEVYCYDLGTGNMPFPIISHISWVYNNE